MHTFKPALRGDGGRKNQKFKASLGYLKNLAPVLPYSQKEEIKLLALGAIPGRPLMVSHGEQGSRGREELMNPDS